tara:strand:+ start:662 stop:955 length:294 start_codon:yes stop_codon:yes gene_type:complete
MKMTISKVKKIIERLADDDNIEDHFDRADEAAREAFPNMHSCLDIRNTFRAMMKATTFFDGHEGSGCGPDAADFRFYTQDGKLVKVSVEEIEDVILN